MAYFSRIDGNNQVTAVVAVHESSCLDPENGRFSEEVGALYCQHLQGTNDRYLVTTTDNNFRGNYGGIGMFYFEEFDVFMPAKPLASWVVDQETFVWRPPVPPPDTEMNYVWDEETTQWLAPA